MRGLPAGPGAVGCLLGQGGGGAQGGRSLQEQRVDGRRPGQPRAGGLGGRLGLRAHLGLGGR
ncbi:MAG: hypothetical protein J0H73_00130, partial [Salana multivorans]|nr:hypothetical protein [Salana multivorans]